MDNGWRRHGRETGSVRITIAPCCNASTVRIRQVEFPFSRTQSHHFCFLRLGTSGRGCSAQPKRTRRCRWSRRHRVRTLLSTAFTSQVERRGLMKVGRSCASRRITAAYERRAATHWSSPPARRLWTPRLAMIASRGLQLDSRLGRRGRGRSGGPARTERRRRSITVRARARPRIVGKNPSAGTRPIGVQPPATSARWA